MDCLAEADTNVEAKDNEPAAIPGRFAKLHIAQPARARHAHSTSANTSRGEFGFETQKIVSTQSGPIRLLNAK